MSLTGGPLSIFQEYPQGMDNKDLSRGHSIAPVQNVGSILETPVLSRLSTVLHTCLGMAVLGAQTTHKQRI